jgi:hypothetical protein
MPTKTITRKNNPKLYKRVTNYRKRRAANLATYRRKKMKFQAKRRPFVEIKSRDHKELWETFGGSTTFPTVDVITDPTVQQSMIDENGNPLRANIFPIWSYMNPVQGVTEKDMLGTTLTAKYLTAKVNFRFPAMLQTNNPKYYMVHGWVKVPPNLTQFTTPTRSGYTRTKLVQHIVDHVNRDFDEGGNQEFLQFKEATNKDYIILGYRNVKPNQNHLQAQTLISAGTSEQVLGKLPEVNLTFKWPMNNRKIKYVRGTDSTMTGSAPFYYDNKGWLPFLLYYCPTAGDMEIGPGTGQTKNPTIRYNNKFWFTDS